MLLPRLATRLLARSTFSASRLVLGHVPAAQITRSFSVSSGVWARAGAAAAAAASDKKASAKKAPAKKKSTTKSAKKPAGKKKKAKKSLRPAGRPRKKEQPVRIKPGDRPPKRPANGYGHFIIEQLKHEQVPEGTNAIQYITYKGKEIGASWRALSEQEKQPYIEQAAAAAADYKRRLEEYIKNTDPKIINEINRSIALSPPLFALTQVSLQRRRSEKGKIKLKRLHPFTNGYILFSLEERQKRPVPTTLDEGNMLVRDLGQAWNALSDEAKQVGCISFSHFPAEQSSHQKVDLYSPTRKKP
ncbi:hypothetical protein ACEPAH_7553 [Sanghuangporus vaninii]